MTGPTIPKFPSPPLLLNVATPSHEWQKNLEVPPGEFVNVVAFKVVMFGLHEVVYSFGYLSSAGAGDVLTGDARLEVEDYNFDPETAWHGGDSLGPASRKKVPVTATLTSVNGHPQIGLSFGAPQQFHYTATLTGVSGHDPSFQSAMVLSGDRTGSPGGKALASFLKTSVEKTHWPPSF